MISIAKLLLGIFHEQNLLNGMVDTLCFATPMQLTVKIYRVSQKKWCTFENAVILNNKQVDLIFLHDLDKRLEDRPPKNIFSFLPLSSMCIFVKNGQKNSFKNSILGAKNTLKCEFGRN